MIFPIVGNYGFHNGYDVWWCVIYPYIFNNWFVNVCLRTNTEGLCCNAYPLVYIGWLNGFSIFQVIYYAAQLSVATIFMKWFEWPRVWNRFWSWTSLQLKWHITISVHLSVVFDVCRFYLYIYSDYNTWHYFLYVAALGGLCDWSQ